METAFGLQRKIKTKMHQFISLRDNFTRVKNDMNTQMKRFGQQYMGTAARIQIAEQRDNIEKMRKEIKDLLHDLYEDYKVLVLYVDQIEIEREKFVGVDFES